MKTHELRVVRDRGGYYAVEVDYANDAGEIAGYTGPVELVADDIASFVQLVDALEVAIEMPLLEVRLGELVEVGGDDLDELEPCEADCPACCKERKA